MIKNMIRTVLLVGISSLLMTNCDDKFDGKSGTRTITFPESDKVRQLIEYKNGKKNGWLIEFYDNGNLKAYQKFKNDEWTDTSYFFHENGKLSSIQFKIDKKKQGCWIRFNKEGGIYSEMCFKDDALNGYSHEYTYNTGRMTSKFYFVDGRQEGKQETFHNNGKRRSVAYYKENIPCLGLKEWDDKGRAINNKFEMQVEEKNTVMMDGKLKFFVRLTDPKDSDDVYRISNFSAGNEIVQIMHLEKKRDYHLLTLMVEKGSFLMEPVKIAAYRKTNFGNIYIETKTINAFVNNY